MTSTAIFVLGLLLLALLVLQSVTGQEKTEDSTMDEEAIKKVLATYVETWNKHDMTAWGALFTDDVDYVNRGGGWWQSNKENVEGHKAIHDMLVKQKQQMTYTSTVAQIAFLKPDVALVHATWEWPGFTLPSGEEVKDFKGIITMVMVKQANTWLIRAVQNTMTSALPQAVMQATSMNTNHEARYIGVSINRPLNEVYAFAANPENLPKWATGLGGSITKVDGEWIAEAPMGKVKIRFVERNEFGILDHDVILESGVKVHNPMRVVPNGRGSEVIFTLFRQPGMSDARFAEDAQWVEKDLRMLRDLLEK